VKYLGKVVDKYVPVLFQKLDTYESEDTRFLKTKIWLCHTGENHNGSFFDRKVLEDAIPSLANTPILAYIEDNSDGDKDFSDHRMVLVREEGQIKIKYIGQAIGVIPEVNNAQFETRLCDDGEEREFLTCEGLVWQKWDDPIDIFNRDIIKSQSMELHEDYEGEFKDDNLFHFSKVSFFGACALGKDVLPAMHNATIEAQFSANFVFNEIQHKMEQFKSLSNCNKGGHNVEEKLELLKKFSLTEESIKEHNINLEEFSLEELEEKLKEIAVPENLETDFALTAEQFRSELESEIRKEKIQDDWAWEYSRYSYVDYGENEVYAFDRSDDYKLFGFAYEVNGDKVTINFDSRKRKKFEIVDFEEGVGTEFTAYPKDAIEYEVKVAEKKTEDKFSAENKTLQDKYTKLEKEVETLNNFKSSKEKEERQTCEFELFERFSSELSEEDIKEIKEKSSEFTLEQLEEKLFTLLGKKKATFSKQPKKEKQSIKIELENNDNDNLDAKPYDHLFSKYATNK
jgi:hypothetical protein